MNAVGPYQWLDGFQSVTFAGQVFWAKCLTWKNKKKLKKVPKALQGGADKEIECELSGRLSKQARARKLRQSVLKVIWRQYHGPYSQH